MAGTLSSSRDIPATLHDVATKRLKSSAAKSSSIQQWKLCGYQT